jgi:hypothetical protein
MTASGTSQSKYMPQLWERIILLLTGVFIIAAIMFLLVRNKPFNDQNLVVLARIVLALAAGICGATIPGFLNVNFKLGGLAIRSGGALALAVLTMTVTPKVLPALANVPVLDTSKAELLLRQMTDAKVQFSNLLRQLDDKLARATGQTNVSKLQEEIALLRRKWAELPGPILVITNNEAMPNDENTLSNMFDLLAEMKAFDTSMDALTTNVSIPVSPQPTNLVPAILNRPPPPVSDHLNNPPPPIFQRSPAGAPSTPRQSSLGPAAWDANLQVVPFYGRTN